MFGGSHPDLKKASAEASSQPGSSKQDPPDPTAPNEGTGDNEGEKKSLRPESPMGRKSDDISPSSEKRSRRTSGIDRAKGLFSHAKATFISPSPTRGNSDRQPQSPIQKLGKTDPVLGVPQGSLNNAAGESVPGARSTFRVGVTEDKNKKCRRTMEDTHAYLYNFLSTPAPALEAESDIRPSTSNTDSASLSSTISGRPVLETDNGYFAIFDGHAGTFAAEWCGKKLHILLEDAIRKNPNTPIPELLDQTFTNVDQQLEKLPLKNSGCTAVVAVLRWEDRVPTATSATGSSAIAPALARASADLTADAAVKKSIDGKTPVPGSNRHSSVAIEKELRREAMRQRVLYTANVGDARIVLCRNGKALRLSYDHKGSDEHEGKRIANAGGLVLNNRVNGVLAVTRALGDAYMKDLVTGHPYTTETVIQPDIDEFLILACDGLWDVCSDQDAVDLVRQTTDPLEGSKQLVEHALARFSTDNLSCMIVRFNSRALQDTVEHRIEPIGVEGDPSSSVVGGISETEAIVGAVRNSLVPTDSKLDKAQAAMILEAQEEQEPGPELDPEGLKKAREKAEDGQKQLDQS